MSIFKTALVALFFLVTTLHNSAAQTTTTPAAVPYPSRNTPKPIDAGALAAISGSTPTSVSVALRLPRLSEAEDLLKAINTPGDPQYHQFLTSAQFAARFAPSDADVAKVMTGLSKYGLTVERTGATMLKVTGQPADLERAFSVSLHHYQVPAHDNAPAYSYHAPLSRPTVPAEISGSVAGVFGLDSRPVMRPLHLAAPQKLQVSQAKPLASGNQPGYLTVADFANQYDVQPLYNRGVSGKGRTVGIMTFASFTPSDAFAYWSAVGLTVDPNRITIVNVDGGPGAPSDSSGSDETTLDVEQSGGIAPAANVVVYQAPNTNQGSVDIFAAAVEANVADSLSISWGFWEWYQNLENAPVTDPITGQTVGITDATHELLVRAAIQGQSVFAASGDSGAYDANRDFGCYPTGCSNPLTVDYPASDTAITGGGGTTLPGLQEYCLNSACTPPYSVDIEHEQVWGWDYLIGLCAALGHDPISCGIFSGGSGGGVSILFDRPFYQRDLEGVQRSQPGQEWILNGQLVYTLPANSRGRNVPDISFNADPQTGYVIYYTSSQQGPIILTFIGGTSFVAPQLNGVTALLGEDLRGSRLGLLNFALYALAGDDDSEREHHKPINPITHGDNWFYHGQSPYSPAAGLGTMDVANFANALHHLF